MGYSYDAVGNRTSLSYPDGKMQNYSYDAANRLAQVVDWLGRGTRYSYDPASNLTTIQYPNGAGIAFNYDTANRLTQIANTEKGIPPLVLAYSLDPVGNRSTISVNGIPTNFAYDALNELVSAQLGPLVATKTTWSFDAVGNRLQQASVLGTTKYAYDAGDRLLTAGSLTFTYDANGSRVSVTDASIHQVKTFSYDAANRLTAATGLEKSSFAYDGDGNRIVQTVGSGTYNYVNDVAAGLPVVLQESGPDGNITYAYGLGLIEEAAPAFNYFYQYDGLGGVIGLTDANGTLQGAYAYDAWGNTLLSVTDVGTRNKFRFTGEALDPGTELYYLRARYYDPYVAQFLSADPFRGQQARPMSMNHYQYTYQNPVRYTDPLGLSPENSTTPAGNQNLTADIASTASSFVQPIIGFGVELFGVTKLGISDLGDAFDAVSGLWEVKQATGLFDQVHQIDQFYASASPAQQAIINNSITTVPGNPTWTSLTQQQKESNLTMVETNLCGAPSMCILGQAVSQGIIP